MKKSNLKKEQQGLLAEKVSLITNQLARYVCPIFHIDEKGELELYGSSLLLKVEAKHFLITAWHVIEKSESAIQLVWSSNGEIALSQIAQNKITRIKSPAGHKTDDIDLAYVELVNAADKILNEFSFLSCSDVEVNDIPSEFKPYIMIGYPEKQTKPKYKQQILGQRFHAYVSQATGADFYKELNKPYPLYFLLNYDRNAIGISGRPEKAPDPHGMSGGGIWSLSNNAPANEISKMGKLVGVILENHHAKEHDHAKRIIVAISISVVLERIRFDYPSLSEKIPRTRLLRVNFENARTNSSIETTADESFRQKLENIE